MALAVVKEEPLLESDEAYGPEKLAAIQQLNVDPTNARFMLLVDDLLRPESLPRGWTSEFSYPENMWIYKDKAGGLHDKHPVYDYYVGAMFMDLGGYQQLKAIAAARPPTVEEVQEMGQYFGIKPDEEKYIWEVAEMALCAPLPPGWKEDVIQEPGDATPGIAFRQETTGAVQQEHPLDNYFRELIRRRRRELLRRKKAALKSLQALIKMGMGRRSLLASVTAQAGNGSDEQHQQEFNDDLDSLDSQTQANLQVAWEGLLGTASLLVRSMQAAEWNGSTGLAATAAADAATSSSKGSAAESSQGPGYSSSQSGVGESPVQHRLHKLSLVLAEALGPSSDPLKAASTALSDIEHLAAMTAAAGSSADAMLALLTDQGVSMPSDIFETRWSVDGYDAANPCVQQESNGGPLAVIQTTPRHSAAVHDSTLDSSSGSQRCSRPSLDSGARKSKEECAQLQQQRQSLLLEKLPFVGADGGGVSMAGAGLSTTGAEPWSLAGGKADAAGHAAAAAARGAAHTRFADQAAAGADPSSSNADEAAADSFGQQFDAAAASNSDGSASASATQAAPATKAGAAGQSSNSSQQTGSQQPGSTSADRGNGAGPQALVYGTEFPPAAEATVRHLTALQGVLQEALGLIRCWQHQKVIIALLQQRLQDLTGRARSTQRHVSVAQRDLQQLQAERDQSLAETAALSQRCKELAEQLQQAQQSLGSAASDQQSLQQRLEEALAELASSKEALAKLQAEAGSGAAAAAQEASDLSTAHKQLQDTVQQLQAELQAAQASAAGSEQCCGQLTQQLEDAQATANNSEQRCVQLEQQLSAVTAQLQQEHASKLQLETQLQQLQAEFAALQAQHSKLTDSSESGAAAAQAELHELKASMQQLQAAHAALQQDHDAVSASAAAAQEQQQHLQQQLDQTQQQLSDLQAAYAALQVEHGAQGQKLAETQEALRSLQEANSSQASELSTAQQALAELQADRMAALDLQEKTQKERDNLHADLVSTQALQEKTQKERETFHADLVSTQAQLTAMQAAADAAEQQRAARPHRGTQVSAADHAAASWVASRGVQTGSELDPKTTKDAGTPADLSLLSYFFREIKQKQRGGGVAIIGYDPSEAAQAATPANNLQTSKLTPAGLPPISQSTPGGRETRSASPAKSAAGPKRAATAPGTAALLHRPAEEDEDETGGFDTRPPPWEVRERVDRRRDRAIKLAADRAAARAGDKWDYAADERDTEIADLKQRLIESKHKARETAARAAEELRAVHAELQSCKRSLEGAQVDNLNLSRDLFDLKLTMQGHDPSSVNADQAWPAAYILAPRAGMPRLSSTGLPGVRSSQARVSTASGAASIASGAASGSEAGLGSATAGSEQRRRESLTLLGGSTTSTSGSMAQSGGLLSERGVGSVAGRPSSAAYGAGRLSALPGGLGTSSPGQLQATSSVGGAAGKPLSPAKGPYATAVSTARKSGIR